MNVLKKISPLLVFVAVLIIAPAPLWAEVPDKKIEPLIKANFSDQTISAYKELYEQPNRARPPLAVHELINLLMAELDEDVVRMFIDLDRATPNMRRIPVSPAQAVKLVASGISPLTVRTVVANELAKVAHNIPDSENEYKMEIIEEDIVEEPVPSESVSPSPAESKQPAPARATPPQAYVPGTKPDPNMVLSKPPPMEKAPNFGVRPTQSTQGIKGFENTDNIPEKPKPGTLGSEIVVQPDGHKVIIYHSGRSKKPVEQVVRDKDGKKVLIYEVGDPDKPRKTNEQRREEEYRKALELLRAMRRD